ncbi:cell wall-binding repeat-containing protein [Halobacillus salinarum]|uniref:Cell wall-binding repeat-containing protein n=1 Tax=Halobacillus salinarum TaxID=2932257 RepID=A0ABY4EMI6_9BACI|nr:cell wall-binding repeat-containing protein [Halobacillus salinarum]UOQ43316.1 cell wall-binding repeat-containing protein [Halobacillus salinarum]
MSAWIVFCTLASYTTVSAETLDGGDDVICQDSCREFSYVDNQSSTFINGKNESEFVPLSSLIAETSSGNVYDHYQVRKRTVSQTSSSTQGSQSPSLTVQPKSLININGTNGDKQITYVRGGNEKLRKLVSKYLAMEGFQVQEQEELPTSQQASKEVSVIFTRAQGNDFIKNGDITSFASIENASKTQQFTAYSNAIQDAVNEYHSEKNVWIWRNGAVTEDPEGTIHYLNSQNINNIYLHFDSRVRVEDYQYFNELANDSGMTVHALMGQPKWGLKNHAREAEDRVDLVSAYNRKVPKEAQFSGIHFDIEPYVLDNWDYDRADVLHQWADSAEEYISYAKEKGFIVGSALPFWTDQSTVTSYYPEFFQEMVDRQDYVTLMAYRNHALGSNSITSLSKGEVMYARSPKVEVGVELLPNEIDYLSFYNRTNLQLEKELSAVRRFFAGLKVQGFKGVTIHDFHSWQGKPPLHLPIQKSDSFGRIAGKSRYETSEAFTNQLPDHSVETIILTDGGNYPDALAGGVLNKTLNGAIMLIDDRQTVIDSKLSEARRLLKPGGEVIILGGEGAVSAKVYNQFAKLDVPISRIAGKNRVETSIAIADKVAQNPQHIYLADGRNFADALSIVPYATKKQRPILLNSTKDDLSQDIKTYITYHPSIKTVTIIGGPNAVTGNAETILKNNGVQTVERIAGLNRAETALKIAKKYYPDTTKAAISNGSRFPDALSGSRYAYEHDLPILLANKGSIDDSVRVFSKQINSFVFYGGEGVLSPDLAEELK